jgi:hypothetical protein
MGGNILGEKKHKKCESITGKKYDVCITGGHYMASCYYNLRENWDYINYKTGEWETGECAESRWKKEEKESQEFNNMLNNLIVDSEIVAIR